MQGCVSVSSLTGWSAPDFYKVGELVRFQVSIKLMTAVWQMKLNHTDKLVFLALADNANDDGICWPSIKTICKKTCLSERGVQASIARLIKENVLQRVIKNGHSSNFYVRPPQDMHPAPYAPTPARRAPHPRTICTHNHQRTIKESSDQIDDKKNEEKKGKLVTNKALVKAIDLSRKRGFKGGWELGTELEDIFLAWIKEEPRNPDAAFLKWVPGYLRNAQP